MNFLGWINLLITPPTNFSQSRHSIDIAWWHSMRPRYTQRQKSEKGILWKCLLLNKDCRHDKFILRSITDILRAHNRFVKCVEGSACSLTSHKFLYRPAASPPTNFTNLLGARSTSVTELITNNIFQLTWQIIAYCTKSWKARHYMAQSNAMRHDLWTEI